MNKIDTIFELLVDNGFSSEAKLIKSVLSDIKLASGNDSWVTYYARNDIVEYFDVWIDQIKDLFKEEKEETMTMIGYELADRFIHRLEYAGYNPYMFKDGASKNERYILTKSECFALGMCEKEFEDRKKISD